jgi:outer membrane autotransporter protein
LENTMKIRPSLSSRTSLVLLTALFCGVLSIATSLHAQSVWIGTSGTSSNWTDAANWQAGNFPMSGADIRFQGSNRTTNTNDNSPQLSISSLGFLPGAASFTLQGNPIGFFNAAGSNLIANTSANTQTLDFNDNGAFAGITLGGVDVTISAVSGNFNIPANIIMYNFGTGGNLTVTGSFDTTITGVISEGALAASLTKNGPGTLTLTNLNTYTGDTTVNNGSLFIDGAVAGNTLVNFNGFLGGTNNGPPNVVGNLVSRGIVSPGDFQGDPEVFVVGKNFHNLVDGTVVTEVGSLTEGNGSDLLFVDRQVVIDGGTIVVPRLDNFSPLPGQRVTVIDTILGRTGTFDTLIPVNWPGLIQPIDLYDDPFTVDIGFVLSNTFESQGLTRNQMAVGAALDNAVLDQCVPQVISFVGNEPLVNLPYEYDLIAPEELASIYEMGFTQANMQGVNLMQRMDDIRAGSTGFCSSVAMEMPTPSYSKESNGKEVINKNPAPAFVPTPENRWGIWVTGSGQFVNVGNDDDNATGYDLSNGNFTVGIDYRLLHNLAFGIYGGYDAGVANLVNDGRITTNGGNVGGFATWFWDKFYVDVSGGGTWNNYKTRRAALLGDAVGSTQGTQYNVHGALGYDWRFGCWNIGPRATFQYTDVNIDQFRERGSLAPLDFPDQNEDSLQSTVGFRASYDLHPSKNVIIRPEFSAAWLHEYNDRAYPIDAGFLGCPGGFTVYGPSVGRDGAQVRAGASAQLNPAFAIYVYYDGLLGRGNYSSNGASGGFTWSF